MDTNELQQDVHLVFSLSDAGSLKVALGQIGKRQRSQVLAFNDCFSVGPIVDLDQPTGQQIRLLWLMEYDGDYRYGQQFNLENQLANMVNTVKNIPEDKNLYIWCADNAHDQTGLRFAVYLLKERQRPIQMVNVSEIYFSAELPNKDGIKPYASGLIDPDHFLTIATKYDEATHLDSSQRKRYETEWLMLSSQQHVLRLWEEDTVQGRDVNALDDMIKASVIELELEQQHDEQGFIKAGAVVMRVFNSSRQLVSYSFLTYRIWILVNQGVLKFKGLPGALHQFSLKLDKSS